MAEDNKNAKPDEVAPEVTEEIEETEETEEVETEEETEESEEKVVSPNNEPKVKGKSIKVKSDRILNLGKLEGAKGSIIHFQAGETKTLPYNKLTQNTIDHHIDVGLLTKVK